MTHTANATNVWFKALFYGRHSSHYCPPEGSSTVGAALLYQTGYDCQGSRKCCMTKVGYDCTAPKEVSTTANQNQPQKSPAYNYTIGHEVNKPGKCPAESTIAGKALFCRSDKDCDGLEKCCVTKVGKECAKAVEKRMLPLAHQIHSCSPSISAAQDAKPNTCPPYPMGSVGAALFCQSGYDCQGSQKCCMTKEVNKPGNCPAEPTIAGKALFCRSDKDCDGSEKCCVTKVGKECVKPVQKPAQNAKPGTCPPYPMGPAGAALFCQTDDDCQGSQKCWMSKVGYDSTGRMEESREVHKPGKFPAEPTIAGKALFCRSDKDCDGSEKCCVTKVGKECIKPVQKTAQSANPFKRPPYPMGPVGAALFCQTRYECQGSRKCCMTKGLHHHIVILLVTADDG
ncbi:hypothetical protein M514_14817 [Trichuris suis]|uniref:WAP domain-containing protein n=1 Tax=Trichuris suis TaxID=68888 RepID=A0A085NTW7_9BILA|nr:hypothetical protein M514_14817 [Trichuris suis]